VGDKKKEGKGQGEKVSKGRKKGDKGEEILNRGLSRHIHCKKMLGIFPSP
jgi:hypothetical protein